MKTSVTLYSFSQYVNAGKLTQLDCIAKAKELGFDGIEFTEIAGANLEEQKENARKLRAEAERVGIDVVSYTITADLYKETEEARAAEVERLKGELDIAAILGAKLMRHDVCHRLGKKWPARSFGRHAAVHCGQRQKGNGIRRNARHSHLLGKSWLHRPGQRPCRTVIQCDPSRQLWVALRYRQLYLCR